MTQRYSVKAAKLSSSLRQAADEAIRGLKIPKPEFAYRIGWASSYDALFRSEFAKESDITRLATRAFESGRVLLSSRGGGGKTVILNRLARECFRNGVLPVVIDLKKWTAPDYNAWKELGNRSSEKAAFLVERFGLSRVSLIELDALPPTDRKILLVDGLNEVTAPVAEEVLVTIDEIIRSVIGLSVIVADRLVRRSIRDSDRWLLASVLPLDAVEIERYLSGHLRAAAEKIRRDRGWMELLQSPFFLDVLLGASDVGMLGGSAHALRYWFSHYASLNPQELSRAGQGAFRVYQKDGARTFPVQDFTDEAGPDVVAKLETAGALVRSADVGYFDHHLKHDYLASLYLAEHPGQWERGAFDVVTLQASSFDTLALVLEQLPEDQGDTFVRAVYDWNPYGAAYAAAGIQHRDRRAVSVEMEHVILAMLAERTQDLMVFTAQRATDALNLFGRNDAIRFRDAATLNVVSQLVGEVATTKEWFLHWRSLFTRPSGAPLDEPEIALIGDTDSVIGWTFTNVIKRLNITAGQQEALRAISAESIQNPTVRWRIAHVLGSFPLPENAEFLLRVFSEDTDQWVRFGAVRSLVELAARGATEVREAVFAGLAERAEQLRSDKICLSEFRKAVFIRTDQAPAGWIGSVGRVLEALHEGSKTIEELEGWERFAYDLKVAYIGLG